VPASKRIDAPEAVEARERVETPAPVDEAPSSPAVPSSEPAASAAPRMLLMSAVQPGEVMTTPSAAAGRGPALTVRRDTAAASPRKDESALKNVAYHPPKNLGSLRKGQRKDAVFGLFGTVFAEREGTIVEIQGMRLAASGQTAGTTRFEVGEVNLAEEHGGQTAYWFLFEDGRLLAWGRPKEWAATASRYRLDLPYSPDIQPLKVEAKVISSGR
jgi:hypothetical protein